MVRLQGGDEECRTRAAQVQDMLAHWCRLGGNAVTASLEKGHAVEIRGTIPDAPADRAAWDVRVAA